MPRSILFSVFQNLCGFLWGKGLGKIPGLWALHGFLFRFLLCDTIIEIEGSKMCVNLDKLPESYSRTFQYLLVIHEREELSIRMFKTAVKEGYVVLDIGANIGFYSLLAARLVGEEGRVYAFEPDPVNYSLLIKNIEINGYDSIFPLQKAVSDLNGKVRLYLDDKDTTAHTIRQRNGSKEFVEVESVTLDEFFAGENRRIDVIKIDIEGAEVRAFSGMEKLIEENEKLKMFIEFYPDAIREMGDSPEDFARRLLDDYGFAVLAIYDYEKESKCLRINSVDELMSFCEGCKGKSAVNLFLEKK